MPAPLSDVDLLARLAAFDTVSRHSNLPLADFLCEYLDRPGTRVARNPSADGTKTNLVFSIGPDAEARQGLVLSGHMDTVPADEPEWESDPFALTERDDHYVARGATDMKGFLAIAANVLRETDPNAMVHPLVLLFTFDEEIGTLGAHRFVESFPDAQTLPRHVVIGEPTSLQVIRLHKGHAQCRVTIEGTPAHSGYPHLGRNAIEPMARAVTALAELRRALESEEAPNREYFPEVPYVPLNVAVVRGGAAVNVVPDHCTLDFGFRLLPGMQSADMYARIGDTLDRALGAGSYTLEKTGESPPLLMSEDARIYRDACQCVAQTTTHSASYATDAGWLQTAGFECVVWGPGSIEVAHKPNERMPIGEFRRGRELIERIVRSYCVG